MKHKSSDTLPDLREHALGKPRKDSVAQKLFDIFRGDKKGTVAWNGLK